MALFVTTITSFFGGSFSILLMVFPAPVIAEIAVRFNAAEYFAVMLFGLIAASTLSSGSVLVGLAMVAVGLAQGMVGIDLTSGVRRFQSASSISRTGSIPSHSRWGCSASPRSCSTSCGNRRRPSRCRRSACPETGRGDPILLVHGFVATARLGRVGTGWVELLTGAGHRVVAHDQRGHRASTRYYGPASYTKPAMAEDARRLLDHLGIERADAMGYSLGALVAAHLAVTHPPRIRALILGGMGGDPGPGPGRLRAHRRRPGGALARCRCHGGCSSEAWVQGCGWRPREPCPGASDERPQECPYHLPWSTPDGAARAGRGRGVVNLRLSNPGHLNALGNAMVVALCEAMPRLAADETCRAILLRARGGGFCAGRELCDVRALQSAYSMTVPISAYVAAGNATKEGIKAFLEKRDPDHSDR